MIERRDRGTDMVIISIAANVRLRCILFITWFSVIAADDDACTEQIMHY
jgi:hypothetical protein